jgi:hypothetical protein
MSQLALTKKKTETTPTGFVRKTGKTEEIEKET